jgi:hypothetical protein
LPEKLSCQSLCPVGGPLSAADKIAPVGASIVRGT